MKPAKRPSAPEPTLVQKMRDAVAGLWSGRSGKRPSSNPEAAARDKRSTRPQAHATEAASDADGKRQRDELARMCAELTVAFDARPNNRKALPQLAAIHQHLGRTGLEVFERAPLALLTKAHDQLLLLAGGHSELRDGALMRLLSENIARRGQDVSAVDDIAWRTPRDSDLMVTEGRMSDFMAANESAPLPADTGKPQP